MAAQAMPAKPAAKLTAPAPQAFSAFSYLTNSPPKAQNPKLSLLRCQPSPVSYVLLSKFSPRPQLKNYRKAFDWFSLAAAQGDVDAQFNLGVMYEKGRGVTSSYRQAFAWYSKAADQGDATAQSNVGVMYKLGCRSIFP